MSYKAERFIQEAIDGALSQTYDNMEIIFSDDASPDKTFEIIEENIKNYTGKHKPNIRIIKNEKNMGIGVHLNKLWWHEAKGDWIVVSAGDDVSLPNRVERLMEFANENVALIHSKPILIDLNSNEIEYEEVYGNVLRIFEKNDIEETIRKQICVRGATMCINAKMLKLFGQFNDNIVNEDIVLAYRSQYYGKIIHLTEPLIKYREHNNSITASMNARNVVTKYEKLKQYFSLMAINSKYYAIIFEQVIADNKILHLRKSFLSELRKKIIIAKVNNFLYGDQRFEYSFLKNPYFYYSSLKKVLIVPYYLIKK